MPASDAKTADPAALIAKLKGTETEKNLEAAFAGESKARNKYTFFASQARKEGYEQIAALFEETAENEKAHGKIWFRYLNGGTIPDTAANLENAREGEYYEFTEMYPNFAKVARAEGFLEIANKFELVAGIEKTHEARYKKLLANVKGGVVFVSKDLAIWKCRECGHVVIANSAPLVCPVCGHPQSFFELKATNY